ncbi:arylsulfatase [Dyadobacter frigoris]|uniref:Arylsulfatase n=1 Tax=Dyadobacter frigoris TaxID=2576211 RepID=A0A4U6CYL1_9BACT|nr:arylsulfatase [Dyadobacter frigoris]TKT88877.1 arylsulfatase [Dyadobacter frigoris]GLU56070.1 sulfatase [Dyadobacter frigoris]
MKFNFMIGLLLTGSTITAFAQKNKKADTRPNIILIMVDDMGYSDIGSYGSEIQTPNLDNLAKEGIRFREFYNNSICAPTRASLITGQYPHKAGIGYFDVNLGLPAYQGYLNKESLTFAEVLKNSGYSTLMSGKWHVGGDSTAWPNQRGFDHFYGFIKGASNYFDIGEYGQAPPVELVKDNKRINLKSGLYLTNEITNNALEFLDEQNKTEKPFFLYVAFNAPHWPLQALPEDIAKYKGRYSIGWDSLRIERIKKQKALGISDPNQAIAKRDPEVPLWDNLTYSEKQLWEKKMEVYAAMVDQVDQNVGRLREKLKELKKDENTLIIFISDNGAQGGYSATNRRKPPRNTGPIGTAGSYDYQEQSWAYVSNTPHTNYKNNMHEGGISAPFIAWFPKQIKGGNIVKGTGHLIDLAPTFYELANTTYPVKLNGVTTNPLPGKSLLPVLTGKSETVDRGEPIFWERAGNRAVRKGKWKIVSTYPAYRWELYDLEKDRSENNDLSAVNTEIVNELSADYFKWADKTGVVDYEKIKPANPNGAPAAGPVKGAARRGNVE